MRYIAIAIPIKYMMDMMFVMMCADVSGGGAICWASQTLRDMFDRATRVFLLHSTS
jgi:hypothetical protein